MPRRRWWAAAWCSLSRWCFPASCTCVEPAPCTSRCAAVHVEDFDGERRRAPPCLLDYTPPTTNREEEGMKRNIIAAAAVVALLGVAIVGGAAVTGTQARKKMQELPA